MFNILIYKHEAIYRTPQATFSVSNNNKLHLLHIHCVCSLQQSTYIYSLSKSHICAHQKAQKLYLRSYNNWCDNLSNTFSLLYLECSCRGGWLGCVGSSGIDLIVFPGGEYVKYFSEILAVESSASLTKLAFK